MNARPAFFRNPPGFFPGFAFTLGFRFFWRVACEGFRHCGSPAQCPISSQSRQFVLALSACSLSLSPLSLKLSEPCAENFPFQSCSFLAFSWSLDSHYQAWGIKPFSSSVVRRGVACTSTLTSWQG